MVRVLSPDSGAAHLWPPHTNTSIIIIISLVTIVTIVTTTVVVKAQPGQGGPGLGWAGLPRQPGQTWPPLLTSMHRTLCTVVKLTKILKIACKISNPILG